MTLDICLCRHKGNIDVYVHIYTRDHSCIFMHVQVTKVSNDTLFLNIFTTSSIVKHISINDICSPTEI